jgi:hypothetical protein
MTHGNLIEATVTASFAQPEAIGSIPVHPLPEQVAATAEPAPAASVPVVQIVSATAADSKRELRRMAQPFVEICR